MAGKNQDRAAAGGLPGGDVAGVSPTTQQRLRSRLCSLAARSSMPVRGLRQEQPASG